MAQDDKTAKRSTAAESEGGGETGAPGKPIAAAARREIPGNLPYLTAAGTLKKMLDKITEAQRPDKFTYDFMENVLKLTGGAARASIPILKRSGFLSSDGTPTELYARFKTDSGRASAALQAMRNGFPEIFKRSEYAHTADDNKIRDIIVEITGLQKNDPVATAIRNTFNVFRSYVPKETELRSEWAEPGSSSEELPVRVERPLAADEVERGAVRLAYNINIVLPETSDLAVLNAIFKS